MIHLVKCYICYSETYWHLFMGSVNFFKEPINSDNDCVLYLLPLNL